MNQRISAPKGSARSGGAADGGLSPRAGRPGHAASPTARVRRDGAFGGLRLSEPWEPAEREADAVADWIMRAPAGGGASSGRGQPERGSVHRAVAVIPEAASEVFRRCSSCGATPCAQCAEREELGSGAPLPRTVRDFVEPRFGLDFGAVRVHADARAADTARALGARAFTVGSHIAFGAGEYDPNTPSGMRLLAHELAHVAQRADGRRGSGTRGVVQRQADGARPSAAGQGASSGLIVDDAAQPGTTQLRKSDFITAVRARVDAALTQRVPDEAARAVASERVEAVADAAALRTSQELESTLQGQLPEAARARSAQDYIDVIADAVGRSMSPTLDVERPNALGAEAGGAGIARKARAAGAQPRRVDPGAVQHALGTGSAMVTGARARMEGAFGADFSHVRIHVDGTASRLADALMARAFTVGHHIAFARGEYGPGTEAGDMLLAHELAHVLQQRGAGGAGGGSGQAARGLEEDADSAAEGIVKRLWRRVSGSSARERGPRLTSRTRLQRQVANYRFQNVSGFDVCIYCICDRGSGLPEKVIVDPDRSLPTDQRCAPGLSVDWGPEGCTGRTKRSQTPLRSNPCPESTNVCQ